MSAFSDTLSQLIIDKNIRVYDLIRLLEMDRSSMYQVIRGKRKPLSDVQIQKVADFMHLDPSEKEYLLEQAKITRLGKKTYYQRKGIEQFLCGFPEDLADLWEKIPPRSQEDAPALPDRAMELCSYLPTGADVNLCIKRLLEEESAGKEGCVRLLLQPEENFLFDILRNLEPAFSLRLEQIICLSNAEEMADEQTLLYIRYLNTILPLYVRSSLDYTAYYYYDKVESHFFHNNGFSYMLLTGRKALLITSDYGQGILLRDPAAVEGLEAMFRRYKRACHKLFHIEHVDMKDSAQIRQANGTVSDKDSCYIMEREVCLLPLLSKDILMKHALPGVPGREAQIESVAAMLQGDRAMLASMKMHLYFTREGLDYFVRTGLFKELPEGICEPLDAEGKCEILGTLKECCEKGIYRMLDGKMRDLSGNLRLCINGKIGYLMFTEGGGRVLYMFLNEPEYLRMFEDYIENMDEDCFCPDEETAKVIGSMIRELEEEKNTCPG